MSGRSSDGEDPDLLAGEYVLGTLDSSERIAFADRMRDEPAVRDAVTAWQQRFAGLTDRVDAVTPPTEVWSRLERALAGHSGATMHQFRVIPGGGGQSAEAGTIRRSRDRWRLGALLTGSIAAVLLVALVGQSLRAPKTQDTYVAAVNRGGDKPALIVRVDMRSGQVLVRPVAAEAPSGRSLELWYIGSDKTPKSMGLIDKAASELKLPGAPADNATFAISVEPPGGSKTGGPTGPVVYSGQLVKE